MSIIEVKEVKKSFGKGESCAEILKGASFSVEKGEFVSLMGASGSGKSTMLYLIGGLDREFEGEIKINDEDVAKKKEKELSKLHNKLYKAKIPLILCFEGWDAAGKGGNIKRIASAFDSRGYEVHPIASPSSFPSCVCFLAFILLY